MTASVHALPVWKKDSTAAEWLEELASLAREHPEQWGRITVVFEELNEDKRPFKLRWHTWNQEHNTGILGTLQAAAFELWEYMKGRR